MTENIALIQLTKNQIALIDKADEPLISKYKWCFMSGGAQTRIGKDRILMHRLLLKPNESESIDHINHNRLDNRRSNLRVVTHQQNTWNRSVSLGKFKGVIEGSSKGKPHTCRPKRFKASITCKGVTFKTEGFPTAELAARAYDELAKKLFGEYACLNFPNDDNETILKEFAQDQKQRENYLDDIIKQITKRKRCRITKTLPSTREGMRQEIYKTLESMR